MSEFDPGEGYTPGRPNIGSPNGEYEVITRSVVRLGEQVSDAPAPRYWYRKVNP